MIVNFWNSRTFNFKTVGTGSGDSGVSSGSGSVPTPTAAVVDGPADCRRRLQMSRFVVDLDLMLILVYDSYYDSL